MYGRSGSSHQPVHTGPTEFDILRASHKFLREDDAVGANGASSSSTGPNTSWGDRLAQKYYASLYREFAVCDLKHYKSGNFALRWRTEDEVISGAGEDTCGNTRCPLHASSDPPLTGLKTVELPFAYEEHGEHKSALVKVVLCDTCLRKLMWKREKKKEKKDSERMVSKDGEEGKSEKGTQDDGGTGNKEVNEEEERNKGARERRNGRQDEERKKRRRSHSHSRSRSPSSHRRKREHKDKHHRHDHSPPR